MKLWLAVLVVAMALALAMPAYADSWTYTDPDGVTQSCDGTLQLDFTCRAPDGAVSHWTQQPDGGVEVDTVGPAGCSLRRYDAAGNPVDAQTWVKSATLQVGTAPAWAAQYPQCQ